ncbi:hypothetical protein BUALT_Bualt15G0106400 [Buddleja alternifolia]|uniref:Uncharacterized protein n=1 Tax=Buddleja alternifolia TaxID=168488 RepID=A0AAV6WLY3_9LAMI|nr:hypothetical protein BUALT_Bualt15G0106400 [Buddleja alternifolia]
MGGNNGHKTSFSLFSFFKGKSSRPRRGDDMRDNYVVKAYKVYPSDEDRGRWVAEPGIDDKASAYISLTTNKWEKLAVANYLSVKKKVLMSVANSLIQSFKKRPEAGNNRQRKSFSLFSFFKGKSSRPRSGDDIRDDQYVVKAYKVYPSDEDRGRWVADPEIDNKASAYISLTTNNWEKLAVAN